MLGMTKGEKEEILPRKQHARQNDREVGCHPEA